MSNLDHREIEHFNHASSEWWDKNGAFKTLHDINPLRMQFIKQIIDLHNKDIIDIGCGGGILSETLAEEGANVLGIDAANLAIEAAREHAKDAFDGKLQYKKILIEDICHEYSEKFDVLTCMELLEHVPDPSKLIHDCAKLVKPGGILFFHHQP